MKYRLRLQRPSKGVESGSELVEAIEERREKRACKTRVGNTRSVSLATAQKVALIAIIVCSELHRRQSRKLKEGEQVCEFV